MSALMKMEVVNKDVLIKFLLLNVHAIMVMHWKTRNFAQVLFSVISHLMLMINRYK